MAVVDRTFCDSPFTNSLHEPTPRTVAINEALEIARRFSTYEATQFINGILDAIKRDLDEQQPQANVDADAEENVESTPRLWSGVTKCNSDQCVSAESVAQIRNPKTQIFLTSNPS